MGNKFQVGVRRPSQSCHEVWERGLVKVGRTWATHRCGHLLFLASQVPLAWPCQPPGCQMCTGLAILKLGIHPAYWQPLLPTDGLVHS